MKVNLPLCTWALEEKHWAYVVYSYNCSPVIKYIVYFQGICIYNLEKLLFVKLLLRIRPCLRIFFVWQVEGFYHLDDVYVYVIGILLEFLSKLY